MKRTLYVLLAAAIGLSVGLGASLLLSSFIPACGEDCSQRVLKTVLMGMGGGMLGFMLAALMISRRGLPAAGTSFRACAVLGLLVLAPSAAHYVYTLHGEYRRLQAIAPVQPTTDFFHMAIATREVQGFTEAGQGAVQPVGTIPPWERCLIGIERCDASPRQVEVFCKAGVMNVNEADWLAFTLIPSENSPGAPPLKSMHLCSE